MENRKYNTKSVVEAGLISGIIVILMLMTVYVPLLDTFGMFILPVPVALLYIRHNTKMTVTALVASAIIVSMIFNPIKGISLTLFFGSTGLMLGYGIKSNKNPISLLLLLALVLLAGSAVNLVITAVIIQNTSVADFLTKTFNLMSEANLKAVESVRQIYTNMGVPQETMKQIDEYAKMLAPDFLLKFLGGAVICGTVILAYIDYIVAKAILSKMGYKVRPMTPFTEFYINSFAGALIVLPLPLGIYLQAKKFPYAEHIYASGMLVMQMTFWLIGISVLAYYLKNKYRISKGMIILIIAFTAMMPIFTTIFVCIGLADMIIDFRRINPNRILRK